MNIGDSAHTILGSHIYLPQLGIWVCYRCQKCCNKVRLLCGKICHLQSCGHTAPKWRLLNMTPQKVVCVFVYVYIYVCLCVLITEIVFSSLPSNEFPTGGILWCVDAACFDKMSKDKNRLLLMNHISKTETLFVWTSSVDEEGHVCLYAKWDKNAIRLIYSRQHIIIWWSIFVKNPTHWLVKPVIDTDACN